MQYLLKFCFACFCWKDAQANLCIVLYLLWVSLNCRYTYIEFPSQTLPPTLSPEEGQTGRMNYSSRPGCRGGSGEWGLSVQGRDYTSFPFLHRISGSEAKFWDRNVCLYASIFFVDFKSFISVTPSKSRMPSRPGVDLAYLWGLAIA